MSVERIASRYAKSLLDLAVERNELEVIHGDIQGFDKATDNRDLYLLLKSPIINPDKKKQILKSIFEGKVSEMVMSFINIVVNKGREALLPEIADEFLKQYKQYNHISTIKVTSAAPLTEASLEGIKKKFLASDETDDKIEIETAVDPSLIGGFVVEFEDKLYDASVSHKLDMLKKEFLKNEHVKSF